MLARSAKLNGKRDVMRNKVEPEKSVADLVPLEKSGERNAVAGVRR